MTAAETAAQPLSETAAPVRSAWRPWLAFGTGIAVEITANALEVAVVRVRPAGVELLRRVTIARFHERPAVEWATDFTAAIRGFSSAGVTVLLPRHEVIVRQVLLPGVAEREVAAALALRLRSLHPFAEDDAAWCWSSIPGGALVGLTRLATLGRYESLFAEAGIPVASFTFSAAVFHSALRLYGRPAQPVLALAENESGWEVYGENASGAIVSGEFTGTAGRAASHAISQLRLSRDTAAADAAGLLPVKSGASSLSAAGARPLLFAAGIAAACPLLTHPANFLPAERRAGQSRVWLIPTAILAFALILAAVALFAVGPYRERRSIEALQEQILAAQPGAQRAAALDRRIAADRDQIVLLDRFRNRSRADFDILNELTRILPPPTWTTMVEIFPDYVIIAGEAEQASPLLKVLDSSPYFQDSSFTNSVTRSVSKNELFRIKTFRRPR